MLQKVTFSFLVLGFFLYLLTDNNKTSMKYGAIFQYVYSFCFVSLSIQDAYGRKATLAIGFWASPPLTYLEWQASFLKFLNKFNSPSWVQEDAAS